jgi:hypothetical protein
MENIKDSFRVDTPLESTWNTLLDIERIAPCMPGAQLQEIDGDEFRGVVKVKVGPITAQYKGTAKLATVDVEARTITIDASGRDTRGQGNASAMINVVMRDDNGGTHVDIDTELNVTGKVAQFGRGVMGEVSAKILKQFVENLERDVLGGVQPDTAADEAPTSASAAPSTTDAAAPAAPAAASVASGPRKIDMPEVAPVDLFDAAGASVAKRAVPPLVALLLILLVVRWRRRD